MSGPEAAVRRHPGQCSRRDWIRAAPIGLLIGYHIAISFQPWAPLVGFLRSSRPLEALNLPMFALKVWRIPVLFCISDMGMRFALEPRGATSAGGPGGLQ